MAHVDLSPRYQRFIREQLESGRFGSASEVVGEALRLMEERGVDEDDDDLGFSVEEMRAKIRKSLDDPRPSVPAAEVFADLRKTLRAMNSRPNDA